jgi:GMP synthase (glutamine-hydrolysing)
MGRAIDISTTLQQRHGDVNEWFRRALDLLPNEVLDVIIVQEDADPLPSAQRVHQEYAGVLVSGSVKMVTDRLPWSENVASLLRELVQSETTPVLGVCYGHQLLAHACGGLVDYNPVGRSLGTFQVSLTSEAQNHDKLFGCFNQRPTITAHASHMQSVLRLPRNAKLLAFSPRDAHHAMRIGKCAWGVQFHPEFTRDVLNEHVLARSSVLVKEGLDPNELLASTRDTPDGFLLMRRFACLARGEDIAHHL